MSSTSIVHVSGMEVPPSMPIIQETPKVFSRSTQAIPLRRKQIGCGTAHKQRTNSPHDAKETGSETMFPGYISRLDEEPKVTISKNSKYSLVKSSIPK